MATADNERKLSDTVSQGANALLDEAAALILRHAPRTGVHATIVPGLTLYRITSNTFIERSAGELMTSFIVRGRKSTAIGGQVLEYGPGESLVCGIASPSEFHTLDASPENPFLALSVSLDMTVLMEYAGALAWSHKVPKSSDLPNGVHVIRPDEDLAEGFLLLRAPRPRFSSGAALFAQSPRPASRLFLRRFAPRARLRGNGRPRRSQRRDLDPLELFRLLLDRDARLARKHVERHLPPAFPAGDGVFSPAVPKARAALRGAPNAPGARSERHDGVVPGGLREFRAVRARLQEPLRRFAASRHQAPPGSGRRSVIDSATAPAQERNARQEKRPTLRRPLSLNPS